MKKPSKTCDMERVKACMADFEARRIEADELAEALRAVCESDGAAADGAAAFRRRVGQLAERVEMMHFSLCRAERRGAIVELFADFLAELDALGAADKR